MLRNVLSAIFVLVFAGGLAACGDTWRGAKKDTGENLQTTGDAIERTGERIQR